MATTVLIVDDHAGFRLAARAILEAEGFDVIAESATGAEAIAAVQRVAPDLVLLDIPLDELSGAAIVALAA